MRWFSLSPSRVFLRRWYPCYGVAFPFGFAFVCRFLFCCSGFVFYEPGEGGGGLCCLSSSTLRGVGSLSFVMLEGVYIAYSIFRLFSSVPPVSCTCFAAPCGLVVVVRCHSACRLALSFAFPCRLWGGLGFSFGSPVIA